MSEPSGAAKEATAATSNSVCNASEIPCVPDNPKRCECYHVSLAMDAYDGARVAEVMKPSAEGQDFVSEVLLTCLGMDKTPDEAPEVIAHVFSRRIAEAEARYQEDLMNMAYTLRLEQEARVAEARAQERERCALIADDVGFAKCVTVSGKTPGIAWSNACARIRDTIRALASPQEGDR